MGGHADAVDQMWINVKFYNDLVLADYRISYHLALP